MISYVFIHTQQGWNPTALLAFTCRVVESVGLSPNSPVHVGLTDKKVPRIYVKDLLSWRSKGGCEQAADFCNYVKTENLVFTEVFDPSVPRRRIDLPPRYHLLSKRAGSAVSHEVAGMSSLFFDKLLNPEQLYSLKDSSKVHAIYSKLSDWYDPKSLRCASDAMQNNFGLVPETFENARNLALSKGWAHLC